MTSGLITFCAARAVQNPAEGNFTNPPFCKNVQLTSYVTTLATTAVATLLICYKTWCVDLLSSVCLSESLTHSISGSIVRLLPFTFAK